MNILLASLAGIFGYLISEGLQKVGVSPWMGLVLGGYVDLRGYVVGIARSIQYLQKGEEVQFFKPEAVYLVQAIDNEGVYPIEVCETRALAKLAIMRIRYGEALDRQNDRRLLGKKWLDGLTGMETVYGYSKLKYTSKRK